jgi:uncharacterized protein (DUF1810 family)
MPGSPDLTRFLSAQNSGSPTIFERALAELQAGRKRSHWIWFVLPQLQGLGRSAMAQRYGIHGLTEAQAYLEEPLLRQRLEEVISVIGEQLQLPGQSLEHLMGSGLDAAKTISCLTLFEAAGLSRAHCLLELLNIRCDLTIATTESKSQESLHAEDVD